MGGRFLMVFVCVCYVLLCYSFGLGLTCGKV